MNGKHIVAIGVACIDEYYTAEAWIPEGEKCNVEWKENRVGGMIPNAACVFAGMGEKTYLVTALNSGSISQIIKKDLERWQLDLSYVIKDDSLADPKCMIISTPKERSIFVVNMDHIQYKVNSQLHELLLEAKCVYTSVMEFHRLERWEKLAEELAETGVPLVIDAETSTFDSWDDKTFSYAKLIFFNEEGWKKFRCERSDSEAMEMLFQGHTEAVVITLGSEGCYCRTRDKEVRLPGNRVQVLDTTGAGDTFNCSFTECWLSGKSLEYSAEYANAAGAYAVTAFGARAGIVSEKVIKQYMEAFRRQRSK
ncbi:MAG TPA: carbohydrate kinase family protein [Candidatus Blautia faecipullorum]|nr:carbohydrate kinase family protein [Candidatus Blautia faecipullorum]